MILAVGTRLQDFTTGSWALFSNPERKIIGLNTQPFDAAQASRRCRWWRTRVRGWRSSTRRWAAGRRPGLDRTRRRRKRRLGEAPPRPIPRPTNADLPSDAQVIGAVQRNARATDASWSAPRAACRANCTSCGRRARPAATTWNTAISCMGYEIAGGLGVKMADPAREVVVMVGDGSYLMMNSEIATSVMLGLKLIIVVLDNRGYGCINRLQRATGGESFNNLLRDTRHETLPEIDFAAHAAASARTREKVDGHRRPRSGAASGRARPIARASSSSTPIRSRRPMRAAHGGTWRCRKCPSARKSEAGAATRPRSRNRVWVTDGPAQTRAPADLERAGIGPND